MLEIEMKINFIIRQRINHFSTFFRKVFRWIELLNLTRLVAQNKLIFLIAIWTALANTRFHFRYFIDSLSIFAILQNFTDFHLLFFTFFSGTFRLVFYFGFA